MIVRIKPGVRIQGVRPELAVGLLVAASVFDDFSTELVITSVVEGTHSHGSLHYAGQAADLRSKHIESELQRHIRDDLSEKLGNDFDVTLEHDHFHIEYQPKLPFGD